jgi:hypothetical protein
MVLTSNILSILRCTYSPLDCTARGFKFGLYSQGFLTQYPSVLPISLRCELHGLHVSL